MRRSVLLTLVSMTLVAIPTLLRSQQRGPTPKRHTIEMVNFEFRPAVVRVAAGDTVIWINRDVVPHTATAQGAWETGNIGSQETGRVIVKRSGEQNYLCEYHSSMRGKLIVK